MLYACSRKAVTLGENLPLANSLDGFLYRASSANQRHSGETGEYDLGRWFRIHRFSTRLHNWAPAAHVFRSGSLRSKSAYFGSMNRA